MSDFTKRLREATKNVTFCYAKEGGQGYVQKEECTCTEVDTCQASKDRDRFYQRFDEFRCEYGDAKRRSEIIATIKPEFADSEWWKNNVEE